MIGNWKGLMMKKWVVACSLLLSACSSTPEIAYYQLAAEPAATKLEKQNDVLLVNAVSVADYLAGPGIAYQTNDIEMVVTQQNLWVDNLPAQLTRTLAATLTTQLPQWQVASSTTSAAPWQLNVQVDRFQGRYDGSVLISGRWTLTHNDQRWQQSFVQTLPQQKNGYADMVRVMSAGWQAQAVDIAQHLQKLSAVPLQSATSSFRITPQ